MPPGLEQRLCTEQWLALAQTLCICNCNCNCNVHAIAYAYVHAIAYAYARGRVIEKNIQIGGTGRKASSITMTHPTLILDWLTRLHKALHPAILEQKSDRGRIGVGGRVDQNGEEAVSDDGVGG